MGAELISPLSYTTVMSIELTHSVMTSPHGFRVHERQIGTAKEGSKFDPLTVHGSVFYSTLSLVPDERIPLRSCA